MRLSLWMIQSSQQSCIRLWCASPNGGNLYEVSYPSSSSTAALADAVTTAALADAGHRCPTPQQTHPVPSPLRVFQSHELLWQLWLMESISLVKKQQSFQNEEATVDDLIELVEQIVAFHMKHNAEPEAVDLLMEVEFLDLLVKHVDSTNYKRTCLYLTSSARCYRETLSLVPKKKQGLRRCTRGACH